PFAELKAVVQNELDANPMLEPLDQSVAATAANAEQSEDINLPPDGEPLPPEPESGAPEPDPDWERTVAEVPAPTVASEGPDAAAEMRDPSLDKLDWREYLETYSNN